MGVQVEILTGGSSKLGFFENEEEERPFLVLKEVGGGGETLRNEAKTYTVARDEMKSPSQKQQAELRS